MKFKAHKMRSMKIYGIFYKIIKSKYISKRADKMICKKYKILVMKSTFNHLKKRMERRHKINDFTHNKYIKLIKPAFNSLKTFYNEI